MPFLDRIKQWFAPAPPPKIRVVTRDILRVTIDQWRSDETLCATAYKALHDPTVRAMIDVMRTSSVLNWTLGGTATVEQVAMHGKFCEGYVMALNDLESLGEQRKKIAVDEPTFSHRNYLEQFEQPS